VKPSYTSLKEHIESGQYFVDAKKWYKEKYIEPFTQRSFLFVLTSIILIVLIGIIIHIMSLFPSVTQVKYSVNTRTASDKAAQIIQANQIKGKPLASITDILVKNYVIQREEYNYESLKKQFTFIKNNSTRIAFRRFYNFMNIDNPSSPILKYQKNIKRDATIISTKYPRRNRSIVTFYSKVKNSVGEISEDMVWQATIDYEIDKINLNLPSGSRFNFTVTDYQLKLLQDRSKK
jgi:type IV secretion system protein VirB8